MDQLADFVFEETLSTNNGTKCTVVLGRIDGKPCIVKATRLAMLGLAKLEPGQRLPLAYPLFGLDTNDVYSWGTGCLIENASVHLDVIWPATELHIQKHRDSPTHAVRESPRDYATHVVPYIESMRGDRLAWVYGILDNGVEADRVLYRDEHFVLLPNSKWDRKSIETLYLLVLVTRKDLASVRDLKAVDIPLLEHIRDRTAETVEARFGLDPSQIKLYFHYQPSYYHLHVHVANVGFQQQDFGRSLLLDNVVDMLSVRPMREATLSYFIAENHDLYTALANTTRSQTK